MIYVSICSLSLQIPWFVSLGLLEEVGLSWLRDGAKGNAVLWGAEITMLSTASNVSNFKKIQIWCAFTLNMSQGSGNFLDFLMSLVFGIYFLKIVQDIKILWLLKET